MAFTYDPTTSRGRVRLLVGDTAPATEVFSDAEVDALLELNDGEVYRAAAAACRAVAANQSKSAVAWRTLELQLDLREVPEHFRELAKVYDERATAGAVFESYDSAAYHVDAIGRDGSHYVGDPELGG